MHKMWIHEMLRLGGSFLIQHIHIPKHNVAVHVEVLLAAQAPTDERLVSHSSAVQRICYILIHIMAHYLLVITGCLKEKV